jgi:hypothetical protein
MRTLLVSALSLIACGGLAGCDPSHGGFFGPSGGYDLCRDDTDCQRGDVCARSGECFAAEDVRAIAVVWTVDGQPASEAACGDHQSFTLQFFADNGYSFGYQPVPCKAGKFTVDKMPKIIDFVEMFDSGTGGSGDTGSIDDATGEATLDLSTGH